ncbi:hypothetical protein RU639_006777 [Aspergillus parasiticus]
MSRAVQRSLTGHKGYRRHPIGPGERHEIYKKLMKWEDFEKGCIMHEPEDTLVQSNQNLSGDSVCILHAQAMIGASLQAAQHQDREDSEESSDELDIETNKSSTESAIDSHPIEEDISATAPDYRTACEILGLSPVLPSLVERPGMEQISLKPWQNWINTARMVLGPLLHLKVFYGSSLHTEDQIRKDLTINNVNELIAFLDKCDPEDPSTGTTVVLSTYSTFAKRSLAPLNRNEDNEEEDSDIKILEDTQTDLINQGRETSDKKCDSKRHRS